MSILTFSLTPALSRWERENRSRAHEKATDRIWWMDIGQNETRESYYLSQRERAGVRESGSSTMRRRCTLIIERASGSS